MDAAEVKVWRRQERTRLIALRMGISPTARREWGARITAELEALLALRTGALGVFWPFRAEFRPATADRGLNCGRVDRGVARGNSQAWSARISCVAARRKPRQRGMGHPNFRKSARSSHRR
jgi:hypothetical protein